MTDSETKRKIARGEILTPWTISEDTYLVVILGDQFISQSGGIAEHWEDIAFFDESFPAIKYADQVGGTAAGFDGVMAKSAWEKCGFPM